MANPLFLPTQDTIAEYVDVKVTTRLKQAEYFRTCVIPQQAPKWKDNVPLLPWTTAELKQPLKAQHEIDEQQTLKILAELGSASASIITYLDITRATIKETFNALQDDREAQTNLASILGATRFQILHGGKLYPTTCPQPRCYKQDTFLHMMECFKLTNPARQAGQSVDLTVYRPSHSPPQRQTNYSVRCTPNGGH